MNPATLTRHWFAQFILASVLASSVAAQESLHNIAMAESLVLSTGGLALMPAYAKNLLPPSVVSRPLEGEAPTIDLAVGYSKANTSPILKLFLSRMDDLNESAAPSPPRPVASKRVTLANIARRL
jgi:hypothetical protein